jgi:hypothetical protein
MDAALHDFVRVPNWPRGLALMPKYKSQIPNFDLIQRHQNSLTLDMLHKALCKVAESQPAPPKPAPKPKAAPKRLKKQHHVVYRLPDQEKLPKQLQVLCEDVKRWLREQQSIRGTLRFLAYEAPEMDQRKAYDYCARMVKLEDYLQKAYRRLDYYTKYKEFMPGTEPMPPMERLKFLLKHKENDQRYISRYKKKTDPRTMEQVRIRQQRLDELKEMLNE